MKQECPICSEKMQAVNICKKCAQSWCANCQRKMGKCPYCRQVYNEDMARNAENSITEDYEMEGDQDSDPDMNMLAHLFISMVNGIIPGKPEILHALTRMR